MRGAGRSGAVDDHGWQRRWRGRLRLNAALGKLWYGREWLPLFHALDPAKSFWIEISRFEASRDLCDVKWSGLFAVDDDPGSHKLDISQRSGRITARGKIGRNKRRKHAQQQTHASDQYLLAPVHVSG